MDENFTLALNLTFLLAPPLLNGVRMISRGRHRSVLVGIAKYTKLSKMRGPTMAEHI